MRGLLMLGVVQEVLDSYRLIIDRKLLLNDSLLPLSIYYRLCDESFSDRFNTGAAAAASVKSNQDIVGSPLQSTL